MNHYLTLLGLAIAPGLAIAYYVFWQDKYDREPLSLIVKSFLLGVVSIIPAIILELLFKETGLSSSSTNILEGLIACIVGIGLMEEGSKYFFTRRFAYRSEHFNEPFDGITYSVMVSMGFATAENIMYVMQNGMTVAFLRMFTAVPAHAFFAVIIGYFLGIQKHFDKRGFGTIGLIAASVLHGLYDFFIFNGDNLGIYGGALASLIVGYYVSKKAIMLHQQDSPFKPDESQTGF